MALDCSVVNKNFYDLIEVMDKFDKSKRNRAYFKDPLEAAVKLFETEFRAGLEEVRQNPDLTVGQVSSYKSRLKELTESVKKGTIDNKFAQVFWQTSRLGKKDPVIGSVLRNLQRSGFTFRAKDLRDRNLQKGMLTALRNESITRGFESRLDARKADKELQMLDEQWLEAIAKWKNKEPNAQDELFRVRNKIDRLVANSHLKVYDEMIDIIEGKGTDVDGKMVWESGLPKVEQGKYEKMTAKDKEAYDRGEKRIKLSSNDVSQLILPNGDKISDPQYRHMYTAIDNYVKLMDGLYDTLRNGVEKQIQSIVNKIEYNGDLKSAKEMDIIKDRLRGKLMPKYETGFFPHYTRDLNVNLMDGLMPHLEDMQISVNPYNKSKSKKPISQIIKDMNGYIDGHTKRRQKDLESGKFDYQYSRNFVNSITNYISDVNRFNYSAFTNANMLDGLMAVERIYKTEGMASGYAESLTNYLLDLHLAANGNAQASETSKNIMRSLLGFEFISKLGMNPRGATRNAFQRLLDYVAWGPVQISHMKNYLRTLAFKGGSAEAYVETQLKEAGLYFEEVTPELLETGLQARASLFKVINWNDATGKYEASKKLRSQKIADVVGIIAAKSSWLHRKAENMNRKHTFKIAFAQMHSWLNTADYRVRLLEQAAETKSGKKNIEKGREALSEEQVETRIKGKAKNYAINMVVMNHFDYADYAKAKWMRSKIGRFAGQFQHFSFEFLERNIAIAREAKHDMLNGKLFPTDSAQGIQKAARMSFLYFLAPVIASALTGVNFTNLVAHDTAQRIQQWATLLTGDDDEIQEAFYGKGPIISTFGGPITSDIVDIGVMMDLINLDEDSLFTLITGLEQYDPTNRSTVISKQLRILNTFAGRVYERHIPQLQKGRIGWALQQELGLYPTAEARKIQRMVGLEAEKKKREKKSKYKPPVRKIPLSLEQAFAMLEKG